MTTISSAEAAVLCCGYNIGYYDKADIEKWADRQIEITENPSTELLDLSMIRHAHPIDVINLLRSFGPTDPAISIQVQLGFIGLLLGKQGISTPDAISGLWALRDDPGTTQEQKSRIYFLDDGYDLAVAGTYGTMADVKRELQEFVKPYADRLAEQFPHLVPSLKFRAPSGGTGGL